jgi:hypothetical protein
MQTEERWLNDMQVLERVTTKQAAKELNMGQETLQYMMRLNRLPIGQAVRKEGNKKYTYMIYRGLLDNYINVLSGKSDVERYEFLYGSKDTDNKNEA